MQTNMRGWRKLAFGAVCLGLAMIADGVAAAAGQAQPTPYLITAQGPNHRIWQSTAYETLPDGSQVPHQHSVTELKSGLNYLNATGQWTESKELMEPFPQGAIARQGQYQVIFSSQLNTEGAIDMQTGDGNRLRSTILGLMYVDPVTGNAVTIARLQDSAGQMVSANQVLYPNAFTGVSADVRYSYTVSGLEQDVILREQPPAPEAFGMDSATTELVVFTEFNDSVPAWRAVPVAAAADNEADEEIGWGGVHLGQGKAFMLNGRDVPAKVIKQYLNLQGRHFLLERVRCSKIQASLKELPKQASRTLRPAMMVAKNWVLPKPAGTHAGAKPMGLALNQGSAKGYVLDYVTVSSGFTNYTFQGDTTYYISGNLALYGTTTFEGGTVIKYAANGEVQITPGPPGTTPGINWGGSAYLPVILTAKDDNSVGESFGTGTPSGYYGNPMLLLAGFSPQTALTGARLLYA